MARLGRLGARVIPAQRMAEAEPVSAGQAQEPVTLTAEAAETSEQSKVLETDHDDGPAAEPVQEPVPEKPTVMFQLNGAPLRLPRKEDGRPYYLMDLIQYSGIDLDHPKGAVTLKVNGETGRFQQVLRPGDVIDIGEEERR